MTCYFCFIFNMFEAIEDNDIEKIEELINNGVDVNARDKYERTPLHYAKNYDAAKLLIDNGADVNAKDFYGSTPLYDIICRNNYVQWQYVKVYLHNHL